MSEPASIQKVASVKDHPNADKLDIITLEGMAWIVVSQKGVHTVGDHVCYVECDTVLPEVPIFEFLRDKKFMVKPIRLRKVYSAGLILPLLELENAFGVLFMSRDLGTDISDLIGASHYEKPLPVEVSNAIGRYPTDVIPKTDEDNLLSNSKAFDELKNITCGITQKVDGSSMGVIKHLDGRVEVCSRNLSLEETEGNLFWKMYWKYNMDKIPAGFAINLELYGPGVNGNKMKAEEHGAAAFNVFHITEGHALLSRNMSLEFCKTYGLEEVKQIGDVLILSSKYPTIQSLIDLANEQEYSPGIPAEGIVIRPVIPTYSHVLNKDLSVKVINQNYKD